MQHKRKKNFNDMKDSTLKMNIFQLNISNIIGMEKNAKP